MFHDQKDMFHNDSHQALRALFIEKRKRIGLTEETLAAKMNCDISFINKIESGTFQAGDKIPSENELIKQYNISNTTARKCLQEIELQGWANRIKGKGTFVLNRSVDRHITRVLGVFDAVKESFNDRLIREGFTPKNIVLEKTILLEGISSNINNRHCIMEGPVLKIHRLRYADDVLLKDETKYISMTLCPDRKSVV
jgi:GntR family transcriptional regulator